MPISIVDIQKLSSLSFDDSISKAIELTEFSNLKNSKKARIQYDLRNARSLRDIDRIMWNVVLSLEGLSTLKK